MGREGSLPRRLFDKVVYLFLGLNIAQKLLLGYLTFAALVIVVSVFALSNLNRLNSINESVLKTDVPLIEAADKLIDNLFAQELYGRRYGILNSPDMLAIFKQRSEDFSKIVSNLGSLPSHNDKDIEKLAALHDEFDRIFLEGAPFLKNPSSPKAKKYDKLISAKHDEVIAAIKSISADAGKSQGMKALETAEIGRNAFRVTATVCVASLILGIVFTVIITRNVSGSVNQLKIATKFISEGKFDYSPNIRNRDELGDLAVAFSDMGRRLKRLEEMYIDASPLTRLPGGIAIENVMKKRLGTGQPLAVCMFDLDNFKAYNDRYGYAKGSEMIKETARIIESTVSQNGGNDDFIGHVGGDDFVVVTTPDRFQLICSGIIETFDKTIPTLYDQEDRERGYIAGHSRQGQPMNFPLTTISIAVVTNRERSFSSTLEIGEVAAELKDYAKSFPRSIYVVDKRRKELGGSDNSLRGQTA